jgi:hypothetical protein
MLTKFSPHRMWHLLEQITTLCWNFILHIFPIISFFIARWKSKVYFLAKSTHGEQIKEINGERLKITQSEVNHFHYIFFCLSYFVDVKRQEQWEWKIKFFVSPFRSASFIIYIIMCVRRYVVCIISLIFTRGL